MIFYIIRQHLKSRQFGLPVMGRELYNYITIDINVLRYDFLYQAWLTYVLSLASMYLMFMLLRRLLLVRVISDTLEHLVNQVETRHQSGYIANRNFVTRNTLQNGENFEEKLWKKIRPTLKKQMSGCGQNQNALSRPAEN